MTTRIDRFSPETGDVSAWIVGDDEEVIVIDPGPDAAGVLDAVGDREVLAVICTHGHADHVAAALEVAERDDAPVALHPKDRPLWREAHPGEDADIEMDDGGVFEVADVRLEVIYAPGHTPGSVCLYCEDLGAVFTGHVMLAGGPAPQDGEYPDFAGQLNAIVVSGPFPGRTRVSAGRVSRYSPIVFSCPAKSGYSPSCGAGPVASIACPVNTAPRSSQYRHTEPAVWPGAAMTSSATSATSKTPPSSISMSASSPGWASRQSERSFGCRATGASSRSATSNAAATRSA